MGMPERKIRVGVIFGGRSGEHEVSLVSAASIMRAIDKEKFEVYSIGITKEGRWLTRGDPMAALQAGAEMPPQLQPQVAEVDERALVPAPEGTRDLIPGTRHDGIPRIDVAFPVLHGPYGEDGTVQGLLELADIPYVGAGVLGSALGMDKILMKTVFAQHGLPIAPFLSLKRKEWERNPKAIMDRVEARFGYPCFVKPANLGSSVGITKAHDRAELRDALALAAEFDRKMLAEEAIDAREIECSVLGNDDPIASVPGEIIPSREFYDYVAKYIDDSSELLIPAPISDELAQQVRDLAVRAFLALDCAGMARVDFFLERGTDRIYVNEVNTIPGFTSISMYPKLWEASGISYTELITRLIDLALERHADTRRSRTSYQPDASLEV
jgi:D-alanine-D-alanine ligase